MEIATEETHDEFFDCLFYVRLRTKSKKLCIICQMQEPENEQWHRYELRCGHIMHTRCLRKWVGRKQSVNCPYCGDTPQTKYNRYCGLCEKWGHNNYLDESSCD